jgi:hypothetical protein
MGMLIGSSPSDKPMTVSVHHCLLAHNAGRNPLVQPVEPKTEVPALVDFRNNIVYNWAGNNSAVLANGARVNFVHNLYLKGPDSGATGATDDLIWLLDPAKLYVEGNWGKTPSVPSGSRGRGVTLTVTSPSGCGIPTAPRGIGFGPATGTSST